ncbi:MAG: extracellular solute-binding protein, partial [Pseudomonadota bacterium]
IDIIGMDVIWTAEFAEAGWILPWDGQMAKKAHRDRLPAPLESARYRNRLWAAPFTSNAQLLWYRKDRFPTPPKTWDELIRLAETLNHSGVIQVQGQRYEGLTVFFVSLLASAGGTVLDETGTKISLAIEPTRKALEIMKRIATSPAADPNLSSTREDDARLAFETGNPSFMVNYSFVWPSARVNAPTVAANMAWSRWPSMSEGIPSRVTVGGINLGVGAFTRFPELAFQAAACIASTPNQRLAAERGGMPPSAESLYDDPALRVRFPFADALRETLNNAVQRPQTPLYADISLAISRTLHPLDTIDPQLDTRRLRVAIDRALRSEGLL